MKRSDCRLPPRDRCRRRTLKRSAPSTKLISTPFVRPSALSDWPTGVTDGLGTMVAAWCCADEATVLGCSSADIDLMAEVSAYNEVDCRVMMEAVRYLRGNPVPCYA